MSAQVEATSVQVGGGGSNRCLSCGQFAGDGHTCPLYTRALGAAQPLYGCAGMSPAQLREVQRQVGAELGAVGDNPAPRAEAEEALTRMGLTADHLAASGRMSPEQRTVVQSHLEHSWDSVRAGGELAVREVGVLRRLEAGHAPAVSAQQRLEVAEQHLARARVELGVATLRRRRGGGPVGHALARAHRDEASRAVLRAQVAAAAECSPDDRCPRCGQFAGQEHSCSPSADLPPDLPAGDYAGLRGDARTKEMLADLQTAVAAVVQSGQLQRWLDAMASNGLNRWSLNNRLLAVLQMAQRGDDLTQLHMMGFRQWEKLNRRVSKGEKAVWILAPVTRKVREEDAAGNTSERVLVTGFKSVPVFNISQTQGEPLPDAPVRPAPGQASAGTLEGLRARVGKAGYEYEETVLSDCDPLTGRGTLGYTDPATRRIVVDQRLSPAQQASTIAHELGHVHCGHVEGDFQDYRRHRGRMETEAEMTAYMVNRARGTSREAADAFSPGYIASWSRGDAATITAAMGRATKAFNKIMDGDWPS